MNNLTDPNYLKSFLKRSGLKPRHYLGQNFLVDESVLAKIVTTAQLKKSDTVLEVGPGIGTLTVELLKRAGKVIAVEKDERMMQVLRGTFGGSAAGIGERLALSGRTTPPNDDTRSADDQRLTVIHQDILKFNLGQYIQGPYKVVANIPYYLTSHLIRYFLGQKNKPRLLVLMVQKEVGERVVAKPGKLSILGISVQAFADAEIVQRRSISPSPRRGILPPAHPRHWIRRVDGDGFGNEQLPFIVPKTSFWPQPEVDSVIIKITPKEKYPKIADHKLFFSIVKQAFAGKRKQIKNTIRNSEALKAAGIDPKARPQDLSIEDWIKLYQAIRL